MESKLIRGLGIGALAVVLPLLLPSETQAQQRSGVEIWEANCGRCHMIQPNNKYYAKDWRSLGMHMGIQARLTSAQTEAVISFLVSGARTDATAALPPVQAPRESASLNEEEVAMSGSSREAEFTATPEE